VPNIKALGESMLCFVRNPEGLPRGGVPQRYAHPEDCNTAEAYEVNQLNEWLAGMKKRTGRSSVDYYQTAEDLLREWNLYGVIKNELAPNRATNYGQRSETRMINFIVYGRVKTFNLWGSGIAAGDRLFFVVRKELVQTRINGIDQTVRSWVVTALASRGQRPTAGDLAHYQEREASPELEKNEDPTSDFGHAILVGIAGESLEDGTAPAPRTFHSTLVVLKCRTLVDIHLGM
jgi:hypothetical protein